MQTYWLTLLRNGFFFYYFIVYIFRIIKHSWALIIEESALYIFVIIKNNNNTPVSSYQRVVDVKRSWVYVENVGGISLYHLNNVLLM